MRKSLTVAVLAAAAMPVLLTGCKAELTASDGSKAVITDNGSTVTTNGGNNGGNNSGNSGSGKNTGGQARPAKNTTTGAATTRACTSIDASLEFAGDQTGLIAITNTSAKPCAVKGWPGIRFSNAAGAPLALRAAKTNVPGVPQRFTVAPGGTVFAGIKWKACDKADTNCAVVSGVRVFAPGATRQVNVNLPADLSAGQLTIAPNSLKAGTITPDRGQAQTWN